MICVIDCVWTLLYMAFNNPHGRNDCYVLAHFYIQARRLHAPDVRLHPHVLLRHHRAP